jgi:5-methylcytosine-specific restriction endonuclease McrA
MNDYNDFNWKLKAYQIKKRDNFTCQVCESKKALNVHHIIYLKDKELWDYPDNYLITLCCQCHIVEHFYMKQIGFVYSELLLSGMLACDIYKKIKSNERIIV